MKQFLLLFILISTVFTTGCHNSSGAVWEDTKTVGRYLHRKSRLLWNQDVDSRMIESSDEFNGPIEEEFVVLKDEDLKAQFADTSIPQPKNSPGAAGSPVPSIDKFSSPNAELAKLFKTIHFNTDEHVLRDQKYYDVVDSIANYMKRHPKLYLFIAGHCDQRASEAYNLSLGTRRANMIRNLLVKKGINPNHIYTISFGKEMPADHRNIKEAWAKNRRAEFKIFEPN